MKDRLTTFGVFIPLLGLSVLIVQSELRVRGGPVWRLEIQGYDPRDLVHGHYLRYQYVFDWSQSPPSCGHERSLSKDCCLCLTATGGPPEVRQVDCREVSTCEGWLRSEDVEPPLRYLIPEDRATAIEKLVRTRKAELDVTTTGRGNLAVGDLFIDGVPWRDVLEESLER